MDFNSFISKYLTGNNEVDLNKLPSSFDSEIDESELKGDNKASIFGFTGDISESEFLNVMKKATGMDAETIKDESDCIFSPEAFEDTESFIDSRELLLNSDDDNHMNEFNVENKLYGINEYLNEIDAIKELGYSDSDALEKLNETGLFDDDYDN